jgi:hypothetical protein
MVGIIKEPSRHIRPCVLEHFPRFRLRRECEDFMTRRLFHLPVAVNEADALIGQAS